MKVFLKVYAQTKHLLLTKMLSQLNLKTFFVVGSNLAAKIPSSDKHFGLYLPNIATLFAEKPE